jgi:hypothetical protein
VALSNAEISAAAALKVYFEHASTGQDIVGNSSTDSSTGGNFDNSESCGLALLYAQDHRYLCNRSSYSNDGSTPFPNDYTWFSSHTGLQTTMRSNPGPLTKRNGFIALSADMRAAVNVAFFKYCWIDAWSGNGDYSTDGASAAVADIAALEGFISANPGIAFVFVTMPLQSNESYASRDAYNAAIRAHCATNNRWLFDIADLECHNDAGIKQTDGNGREIADASYVIADGGHLSISGRLKMAKAYWSLMAKIAGQ